jgi:Uma2 family endonuclease
MASVSSPRRRLKQIASQPVAVGPGINLRIPSSVFTLDGFRQWAKSEDLPEKLRVAFLGSEIYLEMGNEELESHNKVKTTITRVLSTLVVERDLGEFFSDGVLITNKDAGVSNNPDAVFISWDGEDAGRIHYVPREDAEGQYTELVGTPDWVLEIVSNSSVRKDVKELRAAYHKAGIAEYWLVDARGADLSFVVLNWRKTGYVAASSQSGWLSSKVFACSFHLSRRRNRRGRWQYELDVRPN